MCKSRLHSSLLPVSTIVVPLSTSDFFISFPCNIFPFLIWILLLFCILCTVDSAIYTGKCSKLHKAKAALGSDYISLVLVFLSSLSRVLNFTAAVACRCKNGFAKSHGRASRARRRRTAVISVPSIGDDESRKQEENFLHREGSRKQSKRCSRENLMQTMFEPNARFLSTAMSLRFASGISASMFMFSNISHTFLFVNDFEGFSS